MAAMYCKRLTLLNHPSFFKLSGAKKYSTTQLNKFLNQLTPNRNLGSVRCVSSSLGQWSKHTLNINVSFILHFI
jgi:hypothetical protein